LVRTQRADAQFLNGCSRHPAVEVFMAGTLAGYARHAEHQPYPSLRMKGYYNPPECVARRRGMTAGGVARLIPKESFPTNDDESHKHCPHLFGELDSYPYMYFHIGLRKSGRRSSECSRATRGLSDR
jgi:hypothetical protein